VKSTIRLVVQKGPREGYGRVDLPPGLLMKTNEEDEVVFYIRELRRTLEVTGVGRYRQPCLIFPLGEVKPGSLVTVERRLVFICKMCGRRVSSKINGLCDKCYNWHVNGDMVAPPYAVLICGRGG